MLDEREFFDEYKIKDDFQQSGLDWQILSDIYDNYLDSKSHYEYMCDEIITYIKNEMNFDVQSIRGRRKQPKHLIEKIIRKRGKEKSQKYLGINVNNYKEIVRDLIGIRILTISKEEWEIVHDWLIKKFNPDIHAIADIKMKEKPQAYTRYGDRDIFHNKIEMELSNKGYRSQHYVVKYKDVYCEIQVRTISEEVFGEFDHRVRYPYRDENKFLKRYTTIVGEFMDSVDELISTCLQMEDTWDVNEEYFGKDRYLDFQNISKEKVEYNKSNPAETNSKSEVQMESSQKIDLSESINRVILRKEH